MRLRALTVALTGGHRAALIGMQPAAGRLGKLGDAAKRAVENEAANQVERLLRDGRGHDLTGDECGGVVVERASAATRPRAPTWCPDASRASCTGEAPARRVRRSPTARSRHGCRAPRGPESGR